MSAAAPSGGPGPSYGLREFVAAGKSFPVAVLAHDRPALLRTTLDSLLAVRGVEAPGVLLVQDGAVPEVKQAADAHGVATKQLTGASLPVPVSVCLCLCVCA